MLTSVGVLLLPSLGYLLTVLPTQHDTVTCQSAANTSHNLDLRYSHVHLPDAPAGQVDPAVVDGNAEQSVCLASADQSGAVGSFVVSRAHGATVGVTPEDPLSC